MLFIIKQFPSLMTFALLTTFFSGFGQTFLISLFIPSIQESFSLSKTQVASIYSLATLTSAFLLPVWGRLLDKLPLKTFVGILGSLLVVGCLILSQARNLVFLFLGFLFVRNLAQGSFAMMASTMMAKAFGPLRGKALSLSNLGYPLSEAVLPSLMMAVLLHWGWRTSWVFLGVVVAVVYLPGALLALKNNPQRKAKQIVEEKYQNEEKSGHWAPERDWTVKEMLADWRFYVLLLPSLLTPGYLTGLFFHQASFAAWKGWTMDLIAIAFISFAVTRAFSALMIGTLVDKFSARKLYSWTLIPLALALFSLGWGQGEIWAYFYLGFAGMTMGAGMTVKGALWAELYGTKWLGSIRGLQASLMVFATAIAPPLFGWVLDSGVSILFIFSILIGVTLISMFLAQIACLVKR